MKPLSLYLHIPFCVKKCEYCDFPSWAGCGAQIAPYTDALIQEIADAGLRYPGYAVNTVFFGGGTPSLLTGAQMRSLMDAVRAAFPLEKDAEISMESNPGTVTQEKLTAYRAAGINRLSIGVQSLDDRLLKSIGRIHTREEAVRAAFMAREAGFDNLNIDLMYGLPGQTIAGFEETLHDALSLNPEHISMYSLIVEEGTPLFRRVEDGEEIPGDEETLAMQHAAARILSGRGLQRYEISNYAKPGFECRHNLTYWRRGEYLGLGCAAHSMMQGARFSNTASLAEYLSGVRETERTDLTDADALEETVMLSLRTSEGMDMTEYIRLLGRNAARKQPVIDRLLTEEMARMKDGRLTLTERGMDVLNAVIERLI